MLSSYSTDLDSLIPPDELHDTSRWITWRASISVRNEKSQKLFAFGDWFWCFSYIKVRFL